MTYGLQIRGSTTELYRLSSKTAVGKPYSVTVLCARQFPRDTHLIFAENSATKTLLSGISGLEPETWILKVSLLYQLSYIPHNRPLTVSTRIYRAMRDTMRLFKSHIVLPPTYTDFNVFSDTPGVQEPNLPFLNQKLSVSPLKPTPEPIREEKVIGP